MRIGDKIKVLLDRRGMTQRELAKRIGITEVSMTRYINNSRVPKGPLVAAMAKALGVSADELLGLAEGPVISDDKPPSAHPEQDIARDIATIIENEKDMRVIVKNAEKYEYHYDHTDCIWYRPEARNRCPVTCAQYRDGWNDAMNYIFRDGNGYRPYRRDEQYGE
jgi:transcriptional regulator with XRE-family HTH domain